MVVDNERGGSTKRYHDPLMRDALFMRSEGQAMNIPPLAETERQADVLVDQLAYWKQRLEGATMILELPTDCPRPPLQTFVGARYSFVLGKALTAALKTLSQHEEVSLFMTLLAAFQALLYRYSGQDDLLFGTPIIKDNQATATDALSSFPNLLVLRTTISGNPTFRDLLRHVHQVVVEAQLHQEVPFEQIVQALQPEPELSRHPLFQVMFILEHVLLQAQEGKEFTLRPFPAPSGTARCDLTLWLQEAEQGLRGWVECNSALFDAATIVRLVGHWQTLLEGIVASADQYLSELPLLTQAERHLLLVEWNATAVAYPSEQYMHQLFEAQVERTPDAVALIFEQQQLTYRELNQQANQLAHYLQQLGVGTEALVGICMERSLKMVVGLLGILKAGAAYVPLDPAYPKERLTFMLEDAQPAVLLTQQHLIERLPPHKQMVCLDTDWQVIAQENKENIFNSVRGQNLAYMLYTSGSTGSPKRVLGTHQAAISRFQWMWNTYPFGPEEVCCQKTTLSFVDAVWEIFGPLLQGIRTVIIPDPVIRDPQQLLQTLAAHAVTRIVLVPSLLRVLLETADELQSPLPNLKYWVSSGEVLPLDLALHFLRSMPHSVLLNLYGSSEVAADATCYDTRNYTSLPCIPIGRPIANTQIYLLDHQMQLVSIGVPGELHVVGDGLARGYFNRPQLTAARFVPDPFSSTSGVRLYKTGDWARYLPDGNIEYLGRMDLQVKIRGMRVELGEIESVLVGHPTVRQAVVMAREDVPGDTRLVVYLVLHEKQTTTIDDLQSHVLKHLPNYMVPSAFVLLEALPLTPNGEVDRRTLPAPDQARPELQSAFVGARTPLEEAIAAIWAQVLEIGQVGIHDNFFALGGHSLLAMQVISQLHATFQVEVSLPSFLEAPTVAHLAKILQQSKASDAKFRKSPLRSISREAYRVPSLGESRGS